MEYETQEEFEHFECGEETMLGEQEQTKTFIVYATGQRFEVKNCISPSHAIEKIAPNIEGGEKAIFKVEEK